MGHNPPRQTRRALITLWDAYDDRRRLWAFCCVCGHSKLFDPDVLGRRFGLQMKIKDASDQFRCKECGAFGGTYLIAEGVARFYVTLRKQREGTPSRRPTLRDLNPRQIWTFICENKECGHWKHLPPVLMRALKEKYGPDCDLIELSRRLRCTKCGQRKGKIGVGLA